MSIFNDSSTDTDLIRWTVTVPRLRRWPRRRSIRSEIKFTICNQSDSLINIRVRLRSPSRFFVFRSITKRKIGRDRIKETSEVFEEIIRKEINRQDETTFLFPFHYRPHLGPLRSPNIMLEYVIQGFDQKGQEVFFSGSRSLVLSIGPE